MEAKIHAIESFKKCADTLASEGESKIDDSADDLVVIDGIKLDKKMRKIGPSLE